MRKVNLYHLDRDGALLAKHVSSKTALKHTDEDGDGKDASTGTALLATQALNAANFDYAIRTHSAGLFVAFCIPNNKLCQARGERWALNGGCGGSVAVACCPHRLQL